MKATKGEKIFYFINNIILILAAAICIYPVLYVLSASFSSPQDVLSGNVILFPKNITLDAYERVMEQKGIWIAYANTIYYTVIGTAVSMVLTVLGAYSLSKRRLKGRSVIMFIIMFTMWFNAGIVPMYLNFSDLNLLDTRASIILGFAISTFNVIILRTFFEGIPESLEEAAKIDGANDPMILIKIYLPLALPSLATIALFYAISKWNGYFWAMVLLKDDNKVPLQVLLKKLVVEMSAQDSGAGGLGDTTKDVAKETVIYATIMVSTLPMIAFYPFMQKFFIKGMTVGAVKG